MRVSGRSWGPAEDARTGAGGDARARAERAGACAREFPRTPTEPVMGAEMSAGEFVGAGRGPSRAVPPALVALGGLVTATGQAPAPATQLTPPEPETVPSGVSGPTGGIERQ